MQKDDQSLRVYSFENVRHTIRLEMLKNGLTATRLTKKLKTSQSYISRRLNGKTGFTLKDIEQIALILEIDPAELLFPDRIVKLPAPATEPILAVSA